MLLSVIIPVLVPDAEFARCVHCLRGSTQEQQLLEIIIVTKPQHILFITVQYPYALAVTETRSGIYSAMNDGAAASSGDYLYFIGKDDMILSSLHEALKVLNLNNPYTLFCDVYWGINGLYSGKPSRLKLLGRNLCHQGIIYSREAFDRHGPYLRSMRVQADHLLNIKILWDRTAASRISYLKQPLAWYSGDGFSMKNRDAVFWRLYPNIVSKYVGRWAMCLLIVYRTLRGLHKIKSR